MLLMFSIMSSAFREGSNGGGIGTPLPGKEKGNAPCIPT